MSKSGGLRLRDVRDTFRLIHDCRDVGSDASAWTQRLVAGVSRLIDADVVACCESRLAEGDPPQNVLMSDHGWPDEDSRQFWNQHYYEGEGLRDAVAFQRFVALPGDLVVRGRDQLTTNDDWYCSKEFNEAHRLVELDDFVAAFARLNAPQAVFGFKANRSTGRGRFNRRERQLVRLLIQELSCHLGTTLTRGAAGFAEHLSPRQQATLRCLLDGDSEKQVALRLGISRHTVHEYVTAVYRSLGVHSRAELMRFCLKTAGPSRDRSDLDGFNKE